MTDRVHAVAEQSGQYLLALIDTVNDESDDAVVLTAVTAFVAFVLAKCDVEPLKFHNEVVGMMARRAEVLGKRRGAAS